MISERCKDWYHNCNKENFKFFILPLFSLVPYRVKIRVPFMFPFLKCHENFCYLWGPYTQLKAGRGRHYWIFNFFHKGHTINSIAKTGFSTFSPNNSFRKKTYSEVNEPLHVIKKGSVYRSEIIITQIQSFQSVQAIKTRSG